MSEKTGAKTEKNGTGFVVHRAALMVSVYVGYMSNVLGFSCRANLSRK